MSEKRKIETDVVHAGVHPDFETGAIMTPIFQTSTYVQEAPNSHKGYDYSRAGNPTRKALEESLAAIEGAKYGLSYSSGLAAEQAIVQLLNPGDEIIVSDDVYGGTGRLFRKLFAKFGLEFKFIDFNDIESLDKCITSKVKLIWVETPSNPLMKIIDIKQISELARKNGPNDIMVVVDNTFASPIFQRPLDLGADIVVHSSTKYLGGHSDVIGGALMTSNSELFEELKFVQFAGGAVPGPIECFLLLRSIKTLAIRMQRHQENTFKVAKFLSDHPKISQVYFPGLSSHPGHAIAAKQMSGYSGMLSFRLKGDYNNVLSFLSNLKIFKLAESLGGVESLINHPEKMTHASVPPELRKKLGIDETLLRLSVGIEGIEDLLADLESGLS